MWTPGHVTRSPSTHSVARSYASRNGTSSYGGSRDGYDSLDEDHMWLPNKPEDLSKPEEGLSMALLQLQRQNSDFRLRTGSALSHGVIPDPEIMGQDLKTPTIHTRALDFSDSTPSEDDPEAPDSIEGLGPMAQLAQSLLWKLSSLERSSPTVMGEDHSKLQRRVDELEKENRIQVAEHQALWKLRAEDLENLIKVRELLAYERKEHEAMKKLRDDDLQNVLDLRGKLASATWTKPPNTSTGRLSIQRGSEDNSLWQIARAEAMEQRVLELERVNRELQAQAKTATTITTMVPTPPSVSGDLVHRIEDMFENSLKYREKMAVKTQQLRSEKDTLQAEVSRLEDRNDELEAMLERLQRKLNI
jgi:hypothetical protein